MTAPSIYGSASGFDTGNTTLVTTQFNGSQFNDGQTVYIAICSDAVDPAQFTTPARFTALYSNKQVAQAIFNATASVFKQANIVKANEGFDGTDYNFQITCNTSERQAWWQFAVDNDGGIGAQGTDKSASSTTATIPGLTTTANNSLVIGIIFADLTTTLTTPTTWTSVGVVSQTSAATVGLYYQTAATSGTVISDQTSTLGTSRAWRGISFEILEPVVVTTISRPNRKPVRSATLARPYLRI